MYQEIEDLSMKGYLKNEIMVVMLVHEALSRVVVEDGEGVK